MIYNCNWSRLRSRAKSGGIRNPDLKTSLNGIEGKSKGDSPENMLVHIGIFRFLECRGNRLHVSGGIEGKGWF